MLLIYRMFYCSSFVINLLLFNIFFDNKRAEGFVRDRFNSSLQQQVKIEKNYFHVNTGWKWSILSYFGNVRKLCPQIFFS